MAGQWTLAQALDEQLCAPPLAILRKAGGKHAAPCVSLYVCRVSNEKAQRHLHRLTRRAALLLREPATGALAGAAKAMGFPDLQLRQQEQAAAKLEAAAATAGQKRRGGKKAAEAAAAAAEAAAAGERVVAEPEESSAALTAASSAALAQLQLQPAAAPFLAGSKYAGQLPRLTRRFAEVAAAAVGSEAAAAGAAATDDLAGEAAGRALELRTDVAKGAKARKKKALTGERL